MPTAQTIDGRLLAGQLVQFLHHRTITMPHKPHLVAIMVGDNPASAVYVRTKSRRAKEIGFTTHTEHLPATTSPDDLYRLIDRLNHEKTVTGILLQLPLPAGFNTAAAIARIAPEKDVDGFHPQHVAALHGGVGDVLQQPHLRLPCTPLGCLLLLHSTGITLAGKHAVVVGRSAIVGNPMAAILRRADCSVTQLHSRSDNPAALARLADIVIVAAGKPHLVTPDWVKPGAVVIDVGINRLPDGSLVGDVDPRVGADAGWLTPVPGGVGPMTVACLMHNLLQVALGYSTVTDFAKLRGWSTSVPFVTAT